MAKTKLEGFSRVAVLKFGASYPYYCNAGFRTSNVR